MSLLPFYFQLTKEYSDVRLLMLPRSVAQSAHTAMLTLQVPDEQSVNPLTLSFLQAAQEALGLPVVDYNAASQEGLPAPTHPYSHTA